MSIVQKGKETNLFPASYGLSSETSVRKEGVILGEPLSGLRTALNDLLADTVDLTHRAWGFHWNVSGSDFAQYHELFGEIYGSLSDSIDPIAENILKIGFDAPFDIRDFVALSSIPPSQKPNTPQTMAVDLYQGLDALVVCLNRAFNVASMLNEQGIANFLADRLDITKKWMWQLRKSTTPEMQKREFSTEQRQALAEKDMALPDGSYPIKTKGDLQNAIQSFGRAKNPAEVKAHIKRRAKALGAEDMIPQNW